MDKSEMTKTIVNNLLGKINFTAYRSCPLEEFHRYAFATLQESSHEIVEMQLPIPLENIRDAVLSLTKAKVETMGKLVQSTLQIGIGQGRVKLPGNGEWLLIDIHPEVPNE
jgi:hypothetical protein